MDSVARYGVGSLPKNKDCLNAIKFYIYKFRGIAYVSMENLAIWKKVCKFIVLRQKWTGSESLIKLWLQKS